MASLNVNLYEGINGRRGDRFRLLLFGRFFIIRRVRIRFFLSVLQISAFFFCKVLLAFSCNRDNSVFVGLFLLQQLQHQHHSLPLRHPIRFLFEPMLSFFFGCCLCISDVFRCCFGQIVSCRKKLSRGTSNLGCERR